MSRCIVIAPSGLDSSGYRGTITFATDRRELGEAKPAASNGLFTV